MVLVTVIMVVLVMSIFAVNILSQSLNQSSSAKSGVNKIVGTQLAKGAFWKAFSDMSTGVAPSVPNETMNGSTFTVSVAAAGASPYTVNVTY